MNRSNVPAQPFGLIPAEDARNALWPMATVLADDEPRSYTWPLYLLGRLNQDYGWCVGGSLTMERAAKPFVVPNLTNADAKKLYHRAQELDSTPGTGYEGTTLNAGAAAAVEAGFYTEYRWTRSVDVLSVAVSRRGPCVVTVPWYTGMFKPDSSGRIRPTGNIEGYHAICDRGFSKVSKLHRWPNTWDGWGKNGECSIHHEDLRPILMQAMLPVRRTG